MLLGFVQEQVLYRGALGLHALLPGGDVADLAAAHRLARLLRVLADYGFQGNTPVREEHLVDVADGTDLDVQSLDLGHGRQPGIALTGALELRKLAEELCADLAAANDTHGHRHVREREAGMRRAERAGEVRLGHDRGDVALGGALGDGDDVDLGPAQGVEELAADARATLHALAHDGNNTAAGTGAHPALLAAGKLQRKGLLHALHRDAEVLLVHRHGDGVLRGALGGEDDVHARAAEGLHHLPGHTRRAEERRARDGQESHLLNGCDCLHWEHIVVLILLLVRPPQPVVPAAVHARAWVSRVEDIAHHHRDPVLNAGHHGGRVQNLAAEVRKLHGLIKSHFLDREGRGHSARVCRVHTIHVLPHRDPRGTKHLGEDRGRVVRAAALQRRWPTGGRAADEAGDHDEGCVRVLGMVAEGVLPPSLEPLRGVLPEGNDGVERRALLSEAPGA
mmetsp:Transcript_103270/g.301263  ORF Transcript_103270/g.301263 Transcript_103270/m.301263 type:complete len:451 (+) Transcript_103270:1004-2356(+)